jgi:hypothetical protein
LRKKVHLAFPNLGGDHSSSGGNGFDLIEEKYVAEGVYGSDTDEGAVGWGWVVWGSMVCTA